MQGTCRALLWSWPWPQAGEGSSASGGDLARLCSPLYWWAAGSPSGKKAWPQGNQRLKRRINGHRWRGGLLLKQPVVCSNHSGGISRTTELQHGDGVIRPDVVRLTLTATSLVRWDEEDPPGTPPLARLF